MDNWSVKEKRRKTTGTGGLRDLRKVWRIFSLLDMADENVALHRTRILRILLDSNVEEGLTVSEIGDVYEQNHRENIPEENILDALDNLIRRNRVVQNEERYKRAD